MNRSRSRSLAAAEQMRQWITEGMRSGRLGTGDRLPTERAWVERLDIPRSAVRKVLGELAGEGLIERTVGSGTVVAGARADPAPPGADQVSPADVMQARLLLEVAMTDLVIRNATTSDLDKMEVHLAAAEKAQTVAQFEASDEAFHRTIAQSTRNALVRQMYELIRHARESALWGQLKQKSLTAENRARYQRDHRDLLAALRRRDADRARQVIQQHLLRIQANMLARQ